MKFVMSEVKKEFHKIKTCKIKSSIMALSLKDSLEGVVVRMNYAYSTA
jgi:hypothetical protein